jgi:hypothetical protein
VSLGRASAQPDGIPVRPLCLAPPALPRVDRPHTNIRLGVTGLEADEGHQGEQRDRGERQNRDLQSPRPPALDPQLGLARVYPRILLLRPRQGKRPPFTTPSPSAPPAPRRARWAPDP